MNQSINLLSFQLFMVLAMFGGCQKLKPESVKIPEYPDMQDLYREQINLLGDTALLKEVILNGKSEIKSVIMDSALWVEEFSFLEEMNPAQPSYVGAFNKIAHDGTTTFTLKKGERGKLKNLVIEQIAGQYSSIKAIIHEDKDVYVHYREIEMEFEDGLFQAYQIKGYQKVLFKDTTFFSIQVALGGK